MAKTTTHKNNFNAGEISPRAYGRYDVDKYQNAVGLLENFLIYQLGGIMYRPGTIFMAEVKNSNNLTNLIPFQYSTAQAYVGEVGNAYMRFFANTGDIVGTPSFTDSETSPKTITVYGNALVSSTQSVFGGGAGFFDGAGDYLTVPDSADWNFDTGDFSIDFWARFNSLPASGKNMELFVQRIDDNNQKRIALFNDGGSYKLNVTCTIGGISQVAIQSNALTININTWYHFAFTRDSVGVVYYFFLSGIASGSNVTGGDWADIASPLYIASANNPAADSVDFDGQLDEVRISKGIARWTSGFTPPISAYTADTYTKLLLHCDVTTLEITSPFLQADIFNIHYAQNADTMYLTNQKYVPQKLTRLSASSFSISPVSFIRGPFLDTNVGNVTITPSADTGATTLTATVPAWGTTTNYIPGDFVTSGGVHYRCLIVHYSGTFATDLAANKWVAEDFFKGTGSYGSALGHEGSLWRIKSGVVKINIGGYTNKTTLVGVVQAEPAGTAGNLATGPGATTDWAEGAFSDYRGYPAICAFHQQRLFYANTPHQPQTFFGSSLGAYDDFNAGTTANDDAVQYELASDQPNPIRWLKSNYNKLAMGTSSGVASVSGSATNIITPTDIDVKFDSDWGTATLMAKRISSFVTYLQSNNYQLRELVYDSVKDVFSANDMNLLADHILRDGGGAIAFDKQQSPNARFWAIRDDGQIAVLTRNPEELVGGWGRIIAGSDAISAGAFEALTTLQRDGYDDRIWVIVKRNINGVVKRYIEYFSYETFTNPWEPVLLDCSLTYDNPITITDISQAAQAVVTAASHGFSNADEVKINLVTGMTEVNGNIYVVSDKDTNTFKLKNSDGNYIDSSAFTDYISGGEVRKLVSTISGLNHLNGEAVSAQVDGSIPSTETYTVTANAITLSEKSAVVTVGLPYTGVCRLLNLSDGSPTGGQTKMRRFYLSVLRVAQSLDAFQIGQDKDNLNPVYTRPSTLTKGKSPTLLTEDIEQYFASWWSKNGEVYIKQSKPLPLFITAIILRSDVEES